MPPHELHELLDERTFGAAHPDVHDFLDATSQESVGHHRDDWIHGVDALMLYGAATGDGEAVAAGVRHLIEDDLFGEGDDALVRFALNPGQETALDVAFGGVAAEDAPDPDPGSGEGDAVFGVEDLMGASGDPVEAALMRAVWEA